MASLSLSPLPLLSTVREILHLYYIAPLSSDCTAASDDLAFFYTVIPV